MYLAYKIINGVLHIQSMPHGPWKVMSAEQITARLAEVESNHSRALLEAEQRGRRKGMEERPVGLSQWSGWDQSRLPWSECKHKDAVLEALFLGPWSVEDAACLTDFIERMWGAKMEE